MPASSIFLGVWWARVRDRQLVPNSPFLNLFSWEEVPGGIKVTSIRNFKESGAQDPDQINEIKSVKLPTTLT